MTARPDTPPLSLHRRPMGARVTMESLQAQLDEALRVNDQLSAELREWNEPHALSVRKYWMYEDAGVTFAELNRTLEAMLEMGVRRPSYIPIVDNGRVVGLELVARVTPRSIIAQPPAA